MKNLFKSIFNNIKTEKISGYKLFSQNTFSTYSYNGCIYRCDVIRSAVRPFYKAVEKMDIQHIRETNGGITVNPEPYLKMLFTIPNPYMNSQMFLEKLAIQFKLNNNAFALIYRDANGYPIQLYPIPALSVQKIYDNLGQLYLKFFVKNGRQFIFRYSDVIHVRQDFYNDDILGDSPAETLTDLMTIVGTTDKGILNAIKNGASLRWLLQFNQVLKPEKLKEQAKDFADTYLKISDENNLVAATDNTKTLEQIKPTDYVPNVSQIDRTTKRIYNVLGVNEKIVSNLFTEDEWNAYYEADIEPFILQLSREMTIKLFSRREIGCGNKIVLGSNTLSCASMSTKLNLRDMVDRGAMTPNEWRATLNLPPIEGGENVIRRLDTAVVKN